MCTGKLGWWSCELRMLVDSAKAKAKRLELKSALKGKVDTPSPKKLSLEVGKVRLTNPLDSSVDLKCYESEKLKSCN